MYESVKESVAAYNKKKKEIETYEDKQVFKWKFIVIGLGVVLLVLIGLMSELIKEISDRKVNKYDTTFVYELLEKSTFLQTTESLEYLLYGLNASSEIVFDSVSLLYGQDSTISLKDMLSKIQGYDNLLYFLTLNDGASNHTFGLFLQKEYPEFEDGLKSANVCESRNHKISSMYNLETHSHYRLNNSDDCFLYKYNQTANTMLLAELFTFKEGREQVNVTVAKSRCYGDNDYDAVDNIYLLTGLVTQNITKPFFLRKIQVFSLQMERKEIDKFEL